MSILLSLLLVQAPPVLPEIDRRALDLQARAEALQVRRPAAKPATKPAAVVQRPARPAAAPRTVQRVAATRAAPATPQLRRAAGGALDLSAITTICRAAGNQADPAGFLATLARSYALSTQESTSLRTNCAAYLAGRADARTIND